jgi:hypothetical protein
MRNIECSSVLTSKSPRVDIIVVCDREVMPRSTGDIDHFGRFPTVFLRILVRLHRRLFLFRARRRREKHLHNVISAREKGNVQTLETHLDGLENGLGSVIRPLLRLQRRMIVR